MQYHVLRTLCFEPYVLYCTDVIHIIERNDFKQRLPAHKHRHINIEYNLWDRSLFLLVVVYQLSSSVLPNLKTSVLLCMQNK